MDPMLEKALDSAKAPQNERKTTRRPAAQPVRPPRPAEQPQAESPQPTTRTETMPPRNETSATPTTTSNIAPRRLLPYPQYLGGRAYTNAAHYSNKDPDAPTPPSQPVVTDAFVANRTSQNLDAVDAAQSKGMPSSTKNRRPPNSNGLSGLGGGLPVGALGGLLGAGGGLPGAGGGLPGAGGGLPGADGLPVGALGNSLPLR